jgi:hypothetical protein
LQYKLLIVLSFYCHCSARFSIFKPSDSGIENHKL